MSLNKLFPQFDEYQLLFPKSAALRESICAFHASIVQLCKKSILLTRQPCKSAHPVMKTSANLEIEGIRKLTTDLRSKLHPQIENIHRCSHDVKEAIALAQAASVRKEQEFQEQERNMAADHRKGVGIFMSRSQNELESGREWRKQRNQQLLSKFDSP